MVKFSIIIPVKAINDYVRETVPYIQSLDGDNWELLILPNESDQDEWLDDRIKLIPSGRVGPAEKRDLGAKYADGDILVFLDDDSYPSSNLLSVATPYFGDESIVAIGGPAITPANDSFWQKVSGAVFLSKFSGGNPERYISLGKVKEIDDWPSVNFMIRKNAFFEVGGFNSQFWPGEDTFFCRKLMASGLGKIFYVPDLVVWHHRREGLIPHLKQVGGYGLHRGYFVKKYPDNSRKLKYFFPMGLTLMMAITIIASLFDWYGTLVALVFFWMIYVVLIAISVLHIIKIHSLFIAMAAVPYIFFTHIFYGIKFIQGLLAVNLKSNLR
jgi:GT2 family glycosyltransferase